MSNIKPILFSTPMVQAILEGRKTMTRRVMKPQPHASIEVKNWGHSVLTPAGCIEMRGYFDHKGERRFGSKFIKIPYGQPGDILWVRESFLPDIRHGKYPVTYKASFNGNANLKRWKPSIHMPKAAARIFLKIKSVTVERLQDIQEAHILAEGVRIRVGVTDENGMAAPFFIAQENGTLSFLPAGWRDLPEEEKTTLLLKAHWAELWCEINGRASWDANPWVWVISFERTEMPANFLK